MKSKKISIAVLIENDQVFPEDYQLNQKLQVIVNKAMAHLNITAEGRELKREDGTPLTDLGLTIEEAGIRDGETLRFFKKAPKPDRDKGFAFVGAGWHEEKSMENFYKAEIEILRGGLNGDFSLLYLVDPSINNGRVAAVGILNYGQEQKISIQIVFPTRYPFAAPRILPLESNESGELMKPPTAKQFGKGNQYGDGAMCLLRHDQWNRYEHNIGWCLRRAQQWLKYASSSDGFPVDKIVVERPSHFQHSGQIIFPKEFIPPDSKTGNITLTQFKPLHYIHEENIIPFSPFNLSLGKESFKWYRFDQGLTLKSLLPSVNGNAFAEIFKNHFGESILDGPAQQNIALFIPDDPNPWHFFKIQVQKIGNTAGVNIAYFLARTIEKELYLRTHEIFDANILSQKKVTIIGLGALGSEVAKSLARNGVGHFTLFDTDTFEVGNSVRHAADLFYIGEDKVQVAKQLILRTNPGILVNTYKVDVLDDNNLLEKALQDSDICIVLTAEEQVDYFLNEFYSQKYQIPFLFGRVSRGGLSGAIQLVTDDSACLNCLRLHEVDTLPTPKKKTVFQELPPEYGNCSSPAFPGSEVDTKEVALQITRISLQALLGDHPSPYPKLPGHQFYWHGPFGSKKRQPFTWEINSINKHFDCEICNKSNKV